MKSPPALHRSLIWGMWLPLVVALSACGAGEIVTEGPQATASPSPTKAPVDLPVAGELQAVSASHPSAAAADAMAKCLIGDTIPLENVAGMAQVAAAKDIVRYVPLTGMGATAS